MFYIKSGLLLACLSFMTIEGQVGQDTAPAKIVFCHVPEFYYSSRCGKRKPSKPNKNIAELIMLDVTMMPFNLEQWFHVDVLPTKLAISSGKVLKIRHAMIQVSNSNNEVIGRVGEQIPCEDTGHSRYLDGNGEIPQLYRNPGIKNVWAYYCPVIDNLSFNRPPTVAMISFKRAPVDAFYVNIALTKEEGDYINKHQEQVFISTLLVDDEGDCHAHTVGPLQYVPNTEFQVPTDVDVPIKCHQAGPAFQTATQQKSPIMMENSVSRANVEFTYSSIRMRPRRYMARVGKPEWRSEIEAYNLKINGINAEGYTASDLRAEALNLTEKEVLRNPNVPLVFADDKIDIILAEEFTKTFDADDSDCDDSTRIKKPEKVEDEVAKIYLECKYSRQCVGEPEGCIAEKNCDFVASWGREGDFLNFGVVADKVTYVAVAVSLDKIMGDDSVTECNREDAGVVAGYTSWNYKNEEGLGNTRLRSCQSMKDFTAHIFNDTKIFCSWKRPVVTRVKKHTFDLNKPYYILIARGQTSSNGVFGNIMKHDYSRVATTSPEVFKPYVGKSPFQYTLSRLHGIALLITWMFLVPVATFAPRYLKGTFVLHRIKVYSVWYGLHMISVTLVIIVTLGATIMLYIFNNYERAKKESRFSTHSILGIMILSMIVLQMVMAYLMAEHNERWMTLTQVKFFHGMNGHLMTILGFACVYTARQVKDGLPCNVVVSFTTYIICYAILHLMMAYQICYSDFIRGYPSSRVYKVFLVDYDKDHDQPRRPKPLNRASREAQAIRKRRLTLDDIDIEDLQEGMVINPSVKLATSAPTSPAESVHKVSLDQEEPGAPMRKVLFLVFVLTLGLFTFYYFILMLIPQNYVDCPSQEILSPGVAYSAGYLYF